MDQPRDQPRPRSAPGPRRRGDRDSRYRHLLPGTTPQSLGPCEGSGGWGYGGRGRWPHARQSDLRVRRDRRAAPRRRGRPVSNTGQRSIGGLSNPYGTSSDKGVTGVVNTELANLSNQLVLGTVIL